MPSLILGQESYPPQAQRAARRKVAEQKKAFRFKLTMLIGGAMFVMVIPVYTIVALMPLYLLAFSTVCLGTLSLCMAVVINDRNKQTYDLYQQLDTVQAQLKAANQVPEYWDGINKVARRNAQTDLARKRRAAEHLMMSNKYGDHERGYLMLAQCAAEEKAGLAAIPELRIGTAEREQVINKLGNHYAAGRLDRDELDTRMDVAAKAKTAVDLATLLRDLP